VKLRFVAEFTKFKDLSNFDYPDPNMLLDNPGTITISSKLNDMSYDDEFTQAPF
jgi:hypothetical protein